MASGSSGWSNSISKGYDFGTDDILCSYDDYGNQDSSNGGLGDATVGVHSSKDFNKSRVTRSAVFPAAVYNQPVETLNRDLLTFVDRGMKKHSDNIVRILEGISSRLSQLELYCYNVDKSVGEMRSDLARDHGEAESKLKSLDKHVQEVHRSVQILRDKQELAETQKELAKLQLVQKESPSSSHSQSTEERSSEPKKTNISSEATNLALSLPHQVTPPQQQSYYMPSNQLPNPSATAQLPQSYLPSNPQYQAPQLQEVAPLAPQPTQSQISQFQQPFTQYQQPWPPQLPPQIQPQPPQPVYSSYPQSQPPNPIPPERNTYLVYDNNGGRTQNPSQQPQYNPSNVPLQNPSHHPRSDLIEKLGNMGFKSDHVVRVIQRLEESGQPVDFNNVLDRLSGNSSAVPERGWGR